MSLEKIRRDLFLIFIITLNIIINLKSVYAQIVDENGNWSEKYAVLSNTIEARLMVRTGDIDNLGFGWPAGFNPFTGNSTRVHHYPWAVNPSDPEGTDRIMVISSFTYTTSKNIDGYTNSTSRPHNSVQPIVLTYSPGAVPSINSALLQIYVDDFQPGLWGGDIISGYP